jgi:hypothetical protein
VSDAPTLTPQEPGVMPGTDTAKLDAIAAGTVGDFAESLDTLTDDELVQLDAIERQGKNRTTAVGAIVREQTRRAAELIAPTTPEPASDKAPLGDDASYAQMHAREIDPSKLTRPVLTLDGWLLPVPSASPDA